MAALAQSAAATAHCLPSAPNIGASLIPLLCAVAIEASMLVWRVWFMDRKHPVVEAAAAQQRLLQRRQALLSVKDDFVEWARIGREINTLQAEYKRLEMVHKPLITFSGFVRYALQPMLSLIVCSAYWSEPVLCVPEWWTFPAAWLLRVPGHAAGCIGIVVWIAACSCLSRHAFGACGTGKPSVCFRPSE